MNTSIKRLLLQVVFGNYFYGICAIALTIEATLQQKFPFNSLLYYVFVFSLTVLYYTRAYITERQPADGNPRSEWYWRNRKMIFATQVFFTLIACIYLIRLVWTRYQFIFDMSVIHWLLLLVFPVIAGLYYGINLKTFAHYTLRNIGWLKPFVIGFVWAGIVTVYPVLFYNIEHTTTDLPDLIGAFLFVKNFMFIAMLCIMFDIKDYAADHNRQLKTFVVKAGLAKTIFFIIIPLCIIGLASFVFYGLYRDFSSMKILLNIVPFLLLIIVAYSLRWRKSILYYLVVIDGLMLVKAIFGSIAMIWF